MFNSRVKHEIERSLGPVDLAKVFLLLQVLGAAKGFRVHQRVTCIEAGDALKVVRRSGAGRRGQALGTKRTAGKTVLIGEGGTGAARARDHTIAVTNKIGRQVVLVAAAHGVGDGSQVELGEMPLATTHGHQGRASRTGGGT